MAISIVVHVDALRSLGFASISGTYATLGTAFGHKTRMVKITNNTDGDMFIGWTTGSVAPASDGTADNQFIPAGGFTLFDFSANPGSEGQFPFCFCQNTQAWVRQSSAPTKGSVYLECIYGKGE